MNAGCNADRALELLRLRAIQPIDHLPRFVGDLVGGGVLVEVQAVLRNVLPILDRLYVTFFRMKNAVNLLDRVDGDRYALLLGKLTHVLDGLAVATDLVTY